MNLIAMVDKNWAIGKGGQQLVTIPNDLKRFQDMTMGKTVVMGRKTFEALPGRRPLHGRVNVILSRNPEYRVNGTITCHNTEDALEYLKQYSSDDICIIGGGEIYNQFLPYCDRAEVTWIDYVYAGDTYFPNLDELADWKMIEESDEQTYFDLCYSYRTYKNLNLQSVK